MYMDDIKVSAKKKIKRKKNNWSPLYKQLNIHGQDIGMEFSIEKCSMLIMKSGKRETTEEIEVPSQESIKAVQYREFRLQHSAYVEIPFYPLVLITLSHKNVWPSIYFRS